MKRILLTAIVVVTTACHSPAAGPIRTFFQRHRPAVFHPSAACSRPMVQFAVPFAAPNPVLFGSPVFPVMDRPLPAAIRGLTLLPGSSGGCGPAGCPRLPAGTPR